MSICLQRRLSNGALRSLSSQFHVRLQTRHKGLYVLLYGTRFPKYGRKQFCRLHKIRKLAEGQYSQIYLLGFLAKAVESQIELHFALRHTVSEIKLKTYLLTQQNPKIGIGPNFTNIPTRLHRKGSRVPIRAPFRYTTDCFWDTAENRFADSAKPTNWQMAKIPKDTHYAFYDRPSIPKSSSISLYDAPFMRYRQNSIYGQYIHQQTDIQKTDGSQKRYTKVISDMTFTSRSRDIIRKQI